MSTPVFAECQLFEKYLTSCTPYVCKYTHESGNRYTKEIKRLNDYTCSAREYLPGSKIRDCLLHDNAWESATLVKAKCDIEEIQGAATLSSETDPLFKKMYLEILKDGPVSVSQINSQELLQVFSSSFFKVVIKGGPVFMVAKSGSMMDVLYRPDKSTLPLDSYILNHIDPAFHLNNEADAATLRRALLAVHLGKEGGSRGANIVRKKGTNWELICEEFPTDQYRGYVIETEGAGRITNIFWSNDISK
jgi:hypothetical protein